MRPIHLPVYLAATLTIGAAAPAAAQPAADPVRYTLTFPEPHTHYVDVEAILPVGRQPQVEVMMPVWTPGSYLVREYARHVEDLAARTGDGKPLTLTKTRKNRWRIETGGAPSVTLTYRVYGRELTVRTNWIDRQYAFLTGAPTFITLADLRTKRPHAVRLVLPPSWKTSMTGLANAPDGAPHHYVAADYDILVDSPIIAGNPAVYEFDVDGKKHYLVNEGEAGVWDGPRSVKDVEKIVRAAAQVWGGTLPYDKYVFINMLGGGASGGLEHLNSTALLANRFATTTRRSYLSWLGLVSHEFFHLWNVKRLRPVELGPFDYENEVYTTSLWIAEGITDYYADLVVRRAGLSTDADYLDELSSLIRTLQNTPGRLEQPVSLASFDAWIKHYRQDENYPNTAISYYTKGAVIGFLLDAKIRKATSGAKSLDDAMRLAYQRYSGARGYTAEEFRKTVEETAGAGFGDWWKKTLDTTAELDYAEALDWFGLRFLPVDVPRAPKAWLGVLTKNDAGRLLVTQVRRGTPAYQAGFNVDDEILAIGDLRVTPEQWPVRMEQYRPGQRVSILISRRDLLTRVDATFGEEPIETWRLRPRADATPDQQQHLKAFLNGPGTN